MSNLSFFLKSNKKERPNVKFKATKSLCDENGVALDWEIRPLSTEENNKLREACTFEVQVQGKIGLYREKLDTNKFLNKLVCASIVFPNLNNAELQDSYGVMTPEELIVKMVDNPLEYNALVEFIQELNQVNNENINDLVDEAKN